MRFGRATMRLYVLPFLAPAGLADQEPTDDKMIQTAVKTAFDR
jgi:hypothetical protein